MAVVGAARPTQFRDWAQLRGWTSIPLYSAAKGSYILDYFVREGASDSALVSMMNVFHTWGSELVSHPMENGHPHHVDIVWPFWNLLDMTPDGRGELPTPIQNYEHAYFSRHVLGGGS